MPEPLFIFKGRTVRVVRNHRDLADKNRHNSPLVDVEDVDTADRFENVLRRQLQALVKTGMHRPK